MSGRNGCRVGWGWWKRLKQRSKMTQIVECRVAMTSTCTQKGQYSTTRPRQMWTNSGSHIRSPLSNWSCSLMPFHQLWINMVYKKHSGKADQLILGSGGSYTVINFSVALSWGNKINFSLYVNMSGFCSDKSYMITTACP